MKMAEIEATNRCNTRCLHCPREALTRPLGMMSWDVFRTVADKVLGDGQFEAVCFSGMGEPTLNPELPRFIGHLRGEIATSLTTNASTLTVHKTRELVDAGLGQAIVSFCGDDQELYRLMTGGLSLGQADRQIRDLVAQGADKVRVSANVSVALPNHGRLSGIRSHLEELGVHDVTFAMCHNRGGYLDDPSVCQTPLPPSGEGRCDIFANTLYVAWNGQVLSCCHDLAGQGYIGDLMSEDLDQILDRKQCIMQTGVRFPMCKDCNDMYRFERDPTPDGRPLSEWIYGLYGHPEGQQAELLDVVRRQEARIRELEQVVRGYERGRFIRFAGWLQRVRRTLRRRLRVS
jgi:hypothetical protein